MLQTVRITLFFRRADANTNRSRMIGNRAPPADAIIKPDEIMSALTHLRRLLDKDDR